jgi:hypothetical protein
MIAALTKLHGKIRLMTLERKRLSAFKAGKFDVVRKIAADEDRVRSEMDRSERVRV